MNREDAISRQAAIDAITKLPHEYRTKEQRARTGGIAACSLIISELPSVSTEKTRWIPVSEGLPEDKQAVLVWCPQYKNIYCAYLEKEQWWIFGAFVQIVPNKVIAWMPLPQPYVPDTNDGKMGESEE